MPLMTFAQALQYFGSQIAIANAFDPPKAKQTVSDWAKADHIPRGAQCELHIITGGRLRADIGPGRRPPKR